MKGLILKYAGSIEGFEISNSIKLASPGKDEVRIRVKAVGLNPSDFQTAEYITNLKNDFPTILGLDISGVVDEVGKGVLDFKKGDRVVYLREISNPYGGFAEYALTSVHSLIHLPDNVSFVDAAASPGAGFTAYKIIECKLRPNPSKTILIHRGAGGVGSFAIQLAKRRGLEIFTTCQKQDYEYVKNLGADHAIFFKTEDIQQILSEKTSGKGVDYIISSIGVDGATKDLDLLAFDGEIACLTGFPDFSKVKFYEKELSIHEIALGLALSGDIESQKSIQKLGKEFIELLSKNEIKMPMIETILLEDIPSKLKELKAGKVRGKIVAAI